MRSQANTVKLLQDNPTLMRLRELEFLEKVAVRVELNSYEYAGRRTASFKRQSRSGNIRNQQPA